MSSQVFTADITNAEQPDVAECLQQLLTADPSSEVYKHCTVMPTSGLDVALIPDGEITTLQIESGTSVDFDFFDFVFQALQAADAEYTVVNLFDSSTGSSHTFDTSLDLDIEFDDKTIAFLGELEEELDEFVEILEDATIQQAVDSSTELVVTGDNVDPAELELAQKLKLLIITEEHFWECMNQF